VRDAVPGRHQVELAGPDRPVVAEAVAVHDLAIDQPGDVCSPVCGCGGTCMPGRSWTSSGPKWSTKHHAPTIRRSRSGNSRRTVVYRPSGTSCPGSSTLSGSGPVAIMAPYGPPDSVTPGSLPHHGVPEIVTDEVGSEYSSRW
jgi:hypothetical protein